VTVTQQLEVPSLSWPEFLDEFVWYQGEHVTAIGPTKSGKTTLFRELMRRARQERTHPWQVVTATKRRDEILDTFRPEGFVKMPSWQVHDAEVFSKVMLAPPLPSAKQKAVQAEAIREALTSVYQQGGWLVLLDELKHIADFLGCKPEVELLLHAGRSNGISVVSAVQRPRHVPLMAYDQADHVFMWESRDSRIRERLAEIGGKTDPDLIEHGLSQLKSRHHFLYIHLSTGKVIESKVEL
jgi:hypothetical protein